MERVLFNQINLTKKSQSKLRSPQKFKKTKLEINEHDSN